MKIEPILPAVGSPTLFQSVCLFVGGDTEMSERKDHGANTHMRLRAWADMPTLRTPENWRMDPARRSNFFQHGVQLVAQLD